MWVHKREDDWYCSQKKCGTSMKLLFLAPKFFFKISNISVRNAIVKVLFTFIPVLLVVHLRVNMFNPLDFPLLKHQNTG